MGKPAQLTSRRLTNKKTKRWFTNIIRDHTVKDAMPFLKELDIRENDVFFLNMIVFEKKLLKKE